MKKILFLVITVSLLCIRQTLAGNVLTVNDVNVPQGGQVTLEVGCEFDTEYTAFELQIALPDGVSLMTDEYGYPVIEKAFDTNHILTGNLLPSNGNYKITCRSMDNLSMPTEGVLFRVTVVADAGLVLGTNLAANITACEFTRTADSKGENLADADFTIHITEFRTILDETSTTMPEAEENANVRVKRTINAGNWSTICLPFAMTEEQVKTAFGNDVELGDFTGYDITEEGDDITGITVNFDNATEIEANHPYIIKVSAPMTEFTVDGVDISPEDVPCVSFGFTTGKGSKAVYHPIDFNGTYVADFDFYNDAQSQALFLSENKFFYATENTKFMKAFRAYFDFDDVLSDVESSSARIAMRFDSITDINKVSEKKSDTSGAIYDLQGRRVNKPIKGIFIKDGKKIVIEN